MHEFVPGASVDAAYLSLFNRSEFSRSKTFHPRALENRVLLSIFHAIAIHAKLSTKTNHSKTTANIADAPFSFHLCRRWCFNPSKKHSSTASELMFARSTFTKEECNLIFSCGTSQYTVNGKLFLHEFIGREALISLKMDWSFTELFIGRWSRALNGNCWFLLPTSEAEIESLRSWLFFELKWIKDRTNKITKQFPAKVYLWGYFLNIFFVPLYLFLQKNYL